MIKKTALIILFINLNTSLINAQISDSLNCKKKDSLNSHIEYCYYSPNKIRYVATHLNNYRQVTSFYLNGKISSIFSIYNSYYAGYYLNFFDNGNLLCEGYYRTITSSNLHLPKKTISYKIDFDKFTDSGDSSILAFENTEYYIPKEGIWKDYYNTGILKQISYFKVHKEITSKSEQIKDGVWEFYSESGKLVRKTHYKDNTVIKIELF